MKKAALLNFINQTTNSKIEGFAGKFDLGNQFLLAATDGVGTKLALAKKYNDFSGIGQDLVAMCVNDIVVHGGKPIFFLDYYACNFLDEDQFKTIIKGISNACKDIDCAFIGGETAEIPLIYDINDCDIAGFAVGIVDKNKYLPKKNINPGDVILGLQSSGLHSNGFSKLIDRVKLRLLNEKELLLEPTRIYVNSCLSVLSKTAHIKALAHITGGGLLDNIPRVLPKGIDFHLEKMNLSNLFMWVQRHGDFSTQEMLETFNCGIGMAVIADNRAVDEVVKLFEAEGEIVTAIGRIE